MADENEAAAFFSYFGRYDEYERLLKEFLPLCEEQLDEQDERAVRRSELFKWLTVILDYYQDQSYLLDPYLERMVSPAIQQFQERAARIVKESSKEPFPWIAHLIYHLIKTRGSKTLVRYFPHSTADLEVAIQYIDSEDAKPTMAWEVRYITLLWLSLVVLLPFDLAQFDVGDHLTTFERLESVAYAHLGKAGLEREGSAILLAHLYARKDCTGSFQGFIKRTIKQLDEGCDDFFALGALQVAGEMAKAGNLTQADLAVLQNLISRIRESPGLISKVIVRKWICKLITRTSISALPSRGPALVRRSLASMGRQAPGRPVPIIDEDVPESVETYLEIMIEYLQDRDSIIRWSAAKGIARISEQLPADFSDQILETILSLFSIHFHKENTAMHELSVMAEPVWHGAALACAEMARRGLVHENHLPTLIDWAGKGLSFDIRKGSHSIGSNVRDAVCYVYWALARAEVGHLLGPFALEMAKKLVITALFDREVHVRRAASAAFQENVGRINIFPHGIPIVAKADFFAVSVRASAFTVAAPDVARHEEYQDALIDHLLSVTLKHWDVSMRQLAAVSLRRICEVDVRRLGPSSVIRAERLLRSFEAPEVHGGLLALSELAASFKEGNAMDLELERLNIFKILVMLTPSTFNKYRNELILEASCQIVANAVSPRALEFSEAKTAWISIVDGAMKKSDPSVQDAAVQSMRAVSMISDCSADVTRLIQGYRQSTPAMQQSTVKLIGALDYGRQRELANQVIGFLLQALQAGSSHWSANLEARQYCYEALPKVLEGLGEWKSQVIPFELSQRIVNQFILGLSDYTNDRRGDVGSWIRMASIRSLKTTLLLYISDPLILQAPAAWIPPSLFQSAASGILKQCAERLDNVRLVAVETLADLSKIKSPHIWSLKNFPDLRHNPDAPPEVEAEWGTARWLFPKIISLLDVPDYHQDLLMGFILSIGSINDSAKQAASKTLIAFAGSKTPAQKTVLVKSIIAAAKANMSSNHVCVPVLQTITTLLDSGALSNLEETEDGRECFQSILALTTWNTDKVKSIQRVSESSKIVSRLLGLPSVSLDAVSSISIFLGHQFPTVRATTAESIYICLQELDFEEDEILEDVLLQASWTDPPSLLADAIGTVIERLRILLKR